MIKVEDAIKAQRRERLRSDEWIKLRMKVLLRDNYVCQQCKAHASEVDHIIPVALTGSDELSNLQALCSKCHKKKTSEDVNKIKKARILKKLKKRKGGGFL